MPNSRWDSIPEALKPRLKMFLSVDLVGSTAFKQAKRGPMIPDGLVGDQDRGPLWLVEILSFYKNFTFELAAAWARWKTAAQQAPVVDCSTDPEFWKGNGDELLFTIELHHPKEATGTLAAWITALRAYRRKLLDKGIDLDVKSTAWLAGFPLANSELAFRRTIADNGGLVGNDAVVEHFRSLEAVHAGGVGASDYIRDYIGPSIDTGFRLAQLATTRRLVISLDVAYLVCSHVINREDCKLKIGYDGKQSLKGVLGGRGYPVFWIDLSSGADIAAAEDTLTGRHFPSKEEIRAYCDLFYKENEGRLLRPFIVDCVDGEFAAEPPGYFEHIQRRHEALKNEAARLDGEEAALKELSEPAQAGPDDDTPADELATALRATSTTVASSEGNDQSGSAE